MLAATLKFMDSLPRALLAVLLGAATCIVGIIDYLTGTDTTFTAIYLIPIGFAAWFLGRAPAFGFAIVSSVLWVVGDIAAGAHYFSALIPAWNVAIRLAVFLVAVQLIVELSKLHRELEKRAEGRAVQLTAEIAARERLERELLHISERVQRRVGHDIHDSLCQHLTGTALAGQVLAENLKAKGSPQARDANRVVELIEEGITLSRNLAEGLNTVRLSTEGLMEALEDFAASTSELFKISCRFECPLPVLIAETEASEHLYRIAQEAVGNAVKHGHAKNILIRLETSGSGKVLRVIDDGSGLPAAPLTAKGMGLRIMSYRAEVIGAKFNIRRAGAAGTVVSCFLPLERELSS
jgi:signal transduction histidine kinase